MFIKRNESSLKQMAYARRVFGAKGDSKKNIALDCGYSPNVANSVGTHIESKLGFNNAMSKLALDSNNLALAAMSEFKARGFEDFSNKDLIGALNAIGLAWSKFNAVPKERQASQSTNKLRTVILQQVENQTIAPDATTPATASSASEIVEVVEEAINDDPMDF